MVDPPDSLQEKRLAFIIPVRHPGGKKVNDYRTIESLLEMTVRSLLRQTCPNILVILVCHGVPAWAVDLDDRVVFLDVSGVEVFGPDRNPTIADKGLRYAIGALYAIEAFDPTLIMLMDADDYVHIRLAERLLAGHTGDEDFDGYMINQGVHIGVSVDAARRVRYTFAAVVREFDFTCGSCRIFDAPRLEDRLDEIHPDLARRFWEPDIERGRHIKVPHDSIEWLDEVTQAARTDKGHIIHLIGRHDGQKGHFSYRYVDFVAAAKSCGHGNHNGPRRGAVHWFRVLRRMPLSECLESFGLPPQPRSFEYLAMIRARSADKRAGNVWTDG